MAAAFREGRSFDISEFERARLVAWNERISASVHSADTLGWHPDKIELLASQPRRA